MGSAVRLEEDVAGGVGSPALEDDACASKIRTGLAGTAGTHPCGKGVGMPQPWSGMMLRSMIDERGSRIDERGWVDVR